MRVTLLLYLALAPLIGSGAAAGHGTARIGLCEIPGSRSGRRPPVLQEVPGYQAACRSWPRPTSPTRHCERTYEIVTHMLAGRPDILEAMAKHGTRLIIIGKDQVYTDMPEYRNSPNPAYQNERVRGTGGLRVTSFGEENLLNLAGDRYDDESIGVHEFCHTIDAALGGSTPTWRKRLARPTGTRSPKGSGRTPMPAPTRANTGPRSASPTSTATGSTTGITRRSAPASNSSSTTPRATTWSGRPSDCLPRTTGRSRCCAGSRASSRRRPGSRSTLITPSSPGRANSPCSGRSKVSDEALLKANDTIRKMFAYRHDILKALIADGARLVVLGRDESAERLAGIPRVEEDGGLRRRSLPRLHPTLKLMVVPEENVLGLPTDPFAGKSMVVSEFARALYRVAGLRPVDPDFEKRRQKQQYELRVKRMDIAFDQRLQKLHDDAKGKGLWRGPRRRATATNTGPPASRPISTPPAPAPRRSAPNGPSTPARR